ncbi:MAG TPA: tRNA lysidine(34) synthetase TilS [Bdellovibrionota bacterium]|nr:tRNA lysidine(34) synthetase TilS [Bdellovibrionota bacterium]
MEIQKENGLRLRQARSERPIGHPQKPIHLQIFRKMRRAIDEHGAFENVTRVMVGLSGGPDSAVLIHMLCELRRRGGPEVVAVHVHHGVRGEEADRDAQVAEQLAEKHGCEFHVIRLRPDGGTAEHRLRHARLEIFRTWAQELRAQRVVLAHQRDDQAETMLLRLLGGTDLRGLRGIRVFRPPLWVRPLLRVSRAEIEKEIDSCGLLHAIDSTNRSTVPRRNFLRHNVIPMLESQFNPQIRRHLAALGESLAPVVDYLEEEARKILSVAACGRNRWLVVPLQNAPSALRRVALAQAYRKVSGEASALRRVQLNVVDHLVMSAGEPRTFALPLGVRVEREQNFVEFVGSV